MAIKDTQKQIEELNKQFKEGKIAPEEFQKSLDKVLKTMKELAEETKKVNDQTIALAASEARLNEMFGDTLSAYEANVEILRQFNEVYGDAFQNTDNLTQAQIEQINATYGSVEAMIEIKERAQEYVDEVDKLGPAYTKALKKSKPFFEDAATKLGLLSKSGNKFVKTLSEMGSMATQPGGLKGLARGFYEAFNPLNIGISILSKVVEQTIKMMFAVDKAGAEFVKTTGFARNFDGLIASTNDRMKQFGISAEDAAKSIASLRQGLSQFDTLTGAVQQKLTTTVASLNEIGVSFEDSTQTISSLNKAFGVSADVAADVTRELAMSGDVLGKTASQITKDFNKSLSTLAVYGTRSVKIFKDIATMASTAGVSVDSLMGIANKFDTFSDSAKTAAKMNAILGTSFSGNNLMMMDHDKRIKHVIKGIQRSGVAFGKLDKFTQQAIANQLGIKDMGEAAKILSMNSREYDRMKRKQAETAKEQEELNKRMKAGMDVVTELKLIMADFAVNLEKGGIIENIKSIVNGLGEFILFLKDLSPYTIAFTGIMFSLGGALLNTVMMIGKVRIVGAAAGKTIEGVGKSISKTITKVGAASAKASPGIGSLSISMGGIALVIGVAGAAVVGITLSLAHLFKTFVEGAIALQEAGVGFGFVAGSLVLFGAAIFGVSFAIKALAASSAALTATGPIGLAIGGAIAGLGGVAFGIGALTSASRQSAQPKMDNSELLKSAETLSDLSTKLQVLVDKRAEIEKTFAAIGTGLKEAEDKLTADIKATIANVALITTGQAAGEMTQGAAGAALSRNLGKFIDSVGAYFTGEDKKKEKVLLQLDGKATKDLLNGTIAEAHKR